MYVTRFVFLFIHQWTLGLLSPFRRCCYECDCTNSPLCPASDSLGYVPRSVHRLLWYCGFFSLLENHFWVPCPSDTSFVTLLLWLTGACVSSWWTLLPTGQPSLSSCLLFLSSQLCPRVWIWKISVQSQYFHWCALTLASSLVSWGLFLHIPTNEKVQLSNRWGTSQVI